jgi:hypothetical protein
VRLILSPKVKQASGGIFQEEEAAAARDALCSAARLSGPITCLKEVKPEFSLESFLFLICENGPGDRKREFWDAIFALKIGVSGSVTTLGLNTASSPVLGAQSFKNA